MHEIFFVQYRDLAYQLLVPRPSIPPYVQLSVINP
ncbi:MAG: hypothetical protein K1000chlam2_01553 [Chlamydiae bacterium]|nr:hypothetical protein [Chlamydiota bacterium]